METTQHTPADVRGRIIRASTLPIEDEETMIAGLRAGAEAVERGELDVDDFVGVWSQYLRQLQPCLAIPCPLCRASAGEPCHEITWERTERRPHNRRRWAFRRERPQADLFEEVSDGE